RANTVQVPGNAADFLIGLQGRVYCHLSKGGDHTAHHEQPTNQYHGHTSWESVICAPMVHCSAPSLLGGREWESWRGKNCFSPSPPPPPPPPPPPFPASLRVLALLHRFTSPPPPAPPARDPPSSVAR